MTTTKLSGFETSQEKETHLEQPQISLWILFKSYFIVGLTAFGMAIIQKMRSMVIEKHWLSEEEVNEGMGMVQLYPGPLMVDFTAYVGYKLRGVRGAIVATIGYILPTFVLMSLLSHFYFTAGNLPWVHKLFLGLEALVVGIIFNVTLDMGGRNVQTRTQAVIMLFAFVALLFKINSILIVLVALLLGAWLIRPAAGKNAVTAKPTIKAGPVTAKQWVSIGAVAAVILTVVAFSWNLKSEIGGLALSLFKIGSVAFGNGLSIISLMQAEVVENHKFLTMSQFADGIALGQITPGSILIIATFLGYKLAGFWGGLLATFAIFSPSFAMTLIFTEVFSHIRNLKPVRGALAGVMASFVGLLGVVLLQLGGLALTSPASLALAGGAFIAVRYFKIDIIWVFTGGLVIWGSLMAVGLV
ncbi:MAG: chromate efflux transporter [Leptolinea sp.]|jgi:chromate transporter|nr:chromate efflux transporter [Leptolinea sp.]